MSDRGSSEIEDGECSSGGDEIKTRVKGKRENNSREMRKKIIIY